MNIRLISQASLHYFSENIFSSLTASQKKIAAIALAILSCVALGYAFFRFCNFKAEPLGSEEKDVIPANFFIQVLKDGRTKKVFRDGTIEVGSFINGKLNGKSERICPDESLLDEEVKPYPEGYGNVLTFKGTFEDGKLNGQGEILFSNGSLYTGTFKDDILVEGTKKYSDSGSDIAYEIGKFINDKLTGQGRIRLKNGKVRQGIFQAGILTRETRDLHVTIHTLIGSTYRLTPSLDDTVGDFKEKIHNHAGIPVDQMRLIYRGRQLEDNDTTLEQEDVLEDDKFSLVLRLGGD